MSGRDPFADLVAAFPEFLKPWPVLSDADMERMREEYEREAIATAQSEQAAEAIARSYKK